MHTYVKFLNDNHGVFSINCHQFANKELIVIIHK